MFDELNEDKRPRYDMSEGLGRRRRLTRLNIDPDELISSEEIESLREEKE
jgi:hypothetical protein